MSAESTLQPPWGLGTQTNERHRNLHERPLLPDLRMRGGLAPGTLCLSRLPDQCLTLKQSQGNALAGGYGWVTTALARHA